MRLRFWKNEDVESHFNEARAIQKMLPQQQKQQTTEERAKRLSKRSLERKINAAMRLMGIYTTIIDKNYGKSCYF